ncbi:MAG TPA: response regulator [Gammaproteobacteria bacterium]|nr:response regulator [Gammaproteobacteria bacterium]
MPHILVVDDSATDQYALRAILEKHGYKVSVASNGREGVEMAQKLGPDLILMDVVMPELNGFQATRELTRGAETSGIPVIMVTSKDAATDTVWAKRQGAQDYVVKPALEKDLLNRIKPLLRAM